MTKAPLALIALGVLAAPVQPLAASSSNGNSARLTVSVRVVSSCGVSVGESGEVDVQCSRGAADRVVVAESEPRVVELERDGTMMTAQVQAEPAGDGSASERIVTLQF